MRFPELKQEDFSSATGERAGARLSSVLDIKCTPFVANAGTFLMPQ